MKPNPQVLEVWGDFACFTRPELKVERFSYPIITPSAARGIFDAIFCKPNRDPARAQFRWQITCIELLKPVAYIALRRNEVDSVASVANVKKWMSGSAKPHPLMVTQAQQRQTMALKDVKYRLTGEIRSFPGYEGKQQSLEAQFVRRATQGKCFHQPCFGCREFPAYFRYLTPKAEDDQSAPVDYSQDLGMMLYDVFDLRVPNDSSARPFVSLFHACIEKGVLQIPQYDSDQVLKPIDETKGQH
jgi:CRISPR-associated protein Cas5d